MPRAPFDLTGRVALVTGGGRGIGAAIVTRLAEAGAKVVIANRSRDVADELASRLSERGLNVSVVAFDKLDRAGLRGLVDEVGGQAGRLGAAQAMFETGGGSATSRTLNFDRHWRNIRTLLNHNPLNQKARVVGDYLVNGTTTYLAEGKVF